MASNKFKIFFLLCCYIYFVEDAFIAVPSYNIIVPFHRIVDYDKKIRGYRVKCHQQSGLQRMLEPYCD